MTDDEMWSAMMAATETPIEVNRASDGIMIHLDAEDPLDFAWQTDAQCRDLIAKLEAALSQPTAAQLKAAP